MGGRVKVVLRTREGEGRRVKGVHEEEGWSGWVQGVHEEEWRSG